MAGKKSSPGRLMKVGEFREKIHLERVEKTVMSNLEELKEYNPYLAGNIWARYWRAKRGQLKDEQGNVIHPDAFLSLSRIALAAEKKNRKES